MGIPFYFKSIINKYSNIVNYLHHNARCEALFLDFNSIIHQSAQRVVGSTKFTTQKELYDSIFAEILKYTKQIVKLVKPQKKIFVYIDGPCPRAKMHQQRKRRFMSVWRQTFIDGICSNVPQDSVVWDSNAVTPGTDFMFQLDAFLLRNKDDLQNDLKVDVEISPSIEFGEGEHKIVNTIRQNKYNEIIIYGLDADLILLSLLEKQSIQLLREAPEFGLKYKQKSQYLLLDINALKTALFAEVSMDNDVDKKQSLIDDYVMLCTLIGNDFLPPLSYLKIKENGLDLVLKAYKSSVMQGMNLVINRSELNFHVLSKVMNTLAQVEDVMMSECCTKYYESTYTGPHNNAQYIDNYPSIHKPDFIINVHENKGWRLDWYHYLFNSHMPETINAVCQKYIEGIQWVHAYYFHKDFNCAWYYPYNYSPCLLDISNYVNNHISGKNVFDICYSSHSSHLLFMHGIKDPVVQLLMVLPPQSSYLLPSTIKPLTTDITKGVCHYYPSSFKLCTFLKTYLWECGAMLPDIDFDHLLKNYLQQKKISSP